MIEDNQRALEKCSANESSIQKETRNRRGIHTNENLKGSKSESNARDEHDNAD